MAANRYRKFLRLAESWPTDPSKTGRDFGMHLRQRISSAFREGPNSKINEKDCDRQYEALQKINADVYRKKFPRVRETSATGSTAEECSMVMATATMEELEYLDRSFFQKAKDYFTSSKSFLSAGWGMAKPVQYNELCFSKDISILLKEVPPSMDTK